MSKKVIGYVGTYTRKTSRGIYRFELDIEHGKFTKLELASQMNNPTYLAISEDNKYLYSVAQDGDMGGVASFEINQHNGELRYMNRKLEEGAPPCHVDIQGDALLAGNYHKGTVKWFEVSDHRSINKEVVTVTHEGHGPHKRQEKPHVHFTGHTPDGKYIVVVDLGTDELVTYKKEEKSLKRIEMYKAKPGSGPRHMAFHPNGNIAYLLTELSSEVIVLDYDSETGAFREKQIIRVIPNDFTETNDASAIHISSDGKFVYTGNRGHNSITTLKVDEVTGQLTLIGHTPTGGEFPRDFSLDPSEKYIVVANQHSNNLVLFSRDETTGQLTALDSKIRVPEAVCVKFLS